jgi:hypothetical protein
MYRMKNGMLKYKKQTASSKGNQKCEKTDEGRHISTYGGESHKYRMRNNEAAKSSTSAAHL